MPDAVSNNSAEPAEVEAREIRREKNNTALRKWTSQSRVARRVKETWHYWRDYFWWKFAAERQTEMYEGVRTYCMFIGYPRSGHSLCGALLNAHPEAMISHELDALSYVQRGISRDHLYALILRRARWFAEVRGNRAVDFDYQVPNNWQGRFERLSVIGDKQGDLSSVRLQKSPHLLPRLRGIVQVPVRIIHVVRNPFDNISTMLRRKGGSLEHHVKGYFNRTETNARLLAMDVNSEIFTIRHEDLIARPKENLKAMTEFIRLQPDEQYLADCAKIVFDSPSRSRSKAPWDQTLIDTVQAKIEQYPFLRGYSFVS